MIDFTDRWTRDWARLHLPADGACLERLLASYAESARHYHTLQHLSECLALFEQVEHLAQQPGEAALALWFHDAVYVPLAHDNEARSAAWAREALLAAGADAHVAERVHDLVMATDHRQPPRDADARLVTEIDLAILGAEPARFAEYGRQIRAEYASVPAGEYATKRRAVLASFLARQDLFTIPELKARFDGQARDNLRRAVADGNQG